MPERTADRLRGYTLMHAALAVGFLSKSAAAWMVPALALPVLVVWERRWRELARWELYAGLVLQAVVILAWVWFVYRGPDGPEHLKVFFWNNLAGRFAHVDAPQELQYAAGHRNSPGKYLLELPHVSLAVDAARRGGPAARVARAAGPPARTPRRSAPGALRARGGAALARPAVRGGDRPQHLPRARRCPDSRCCSAGGRRSIPTTAGIWRAARHRLLLLAACWCLRAAGCRAAWARAHPAARSRSVALGLARRGRSSRSAAETAARRGGRDARSSRSCSPTACS